MNPMFQEVKIMGTGAPYVGQAVRYPGLRGPAISQAPAAAPAVPPSSPDDFVGPCPDGTTQTATGCVPNAPSGAPAAAPAAPVAPVKAPVAPKAGTKTSTYVAGGIAITVLLAAILIPK